jgi:hypothetical protein
MMKNQLEISFDANQTCPRPFRRQQRRQRAQWWFRKMRNVVDTAFDWKSEAAGRAEQIYFPLERR